LIPEEKSIIRDDQGKQIRLGGEKRKKKNTLASLRGKRGSQRAMGEGSNNEGKEQRNHKRRLRVKNGQWGSIFNEMAARLTMKGENNVGCDKGLTSVKRN